MIRALIVDDEPLARETIVHALKDDAEVRVIGHCSGAEAVEAIGSGCPDLVFLDVQMPGLGGFEVLERVGASAVPAVVFVTAYDRYALKAFEVHAVDYLLKPFDDRRFQETLARVKERLATGEVRALEGRLRALLDGREDRSFTSRFVVRSRGESLYVPAVEVDFIESADDYAELHVGTKTYLLRERMTELEQRLDPRRFVRIHRRTIVNVDRVHSLTPLFRGDSLVKLVDGTELRLSRSRREEFERRLTDSPQRRLHSPQAR